MLSYLFFFLAFVSIFSAIMVVAAKNPVQSVLYLIITFFSIAGHYVLLNAQFLAAVHVIVYAGAIMVLFLFVIMLLNLNSESEPKKPAALKLATVITSGTMLVILVAAFKLTVTNHNVNDSEIGLIKNLGSVLFNEFMLPFEVSALLFLIAMIGAVMLGKKEAADID